MAKQQKPRDVVVLSDPRAIRALAHPARLSVVGALYDRYPSLTATRAAEIAGITPSAMSYHLRALEKAGIVKRAESSDDGRERPWIKAGNNLQIDMKKQEGRATMAAMSVLLTTAFDQDREQLAEALSRRANATQRPADEVIAYNRSSLRITLEEARQLLKDIDAIMTPLSTEARQNDDDPEKMMFSFNYTMYPSDPDE